MAKQVWPWHPSNQVSVKSGASGYYGSGKSSVTTLAVQPCSINGRSD